VRLKITIEDRVYEVEVEATEPEVNRPIPGCLIQPGATYVPAAAGAAAGAPAAKDEEPVDEQKVCRSPVNGLVVKVAAQEGQQIQSGDTLLVLEAMKLETNITAPDAGRIKRIRAGVGDSVERGQILVDFE
jgi:biotin carboxyl carrier protein